MDTHCRLIHPFVIEWCCHFPACLTYNLKYPNQPPAATHTPFHTWKIVHYRTPVEVSNFNAWMIAQRDVYGRPFVDESRKCCRLSAAASLLNSYEFTSIIGHTRHRNLFKTWDIACLECLEIVQNLGAIFRSPPKRVSICAIRWNPFECGLTIGPQKLRIW